MASPSLSSSSSSRKRATRGRRLSSRGGASAQAPPRLPGGGARWACAACTFSNSSLMAYCEMCDTPRHTPAPAPPSPEEETADAPPPVQDPAVVIASGSDSEGQETSSSSPPPRRDGLLSPGAVGSSGGGGAGGGGQDSVSAGQTEGPPGIQLASQPRAEDEDEGGGEREGRVADRDDGAGSSLPLYPGLQFCPSRYTDRVHVYDEDGAPLSCNFVPLDIQLDNWDDLPEALSRRPENRRQVLVYVRDWVSLSAMKQRLLRRGAPPPCRTPALALEALHAAQAPHSSTQRYLGREHVAQASLVRAQQEGGHTRLITKDSFFSRRRRAPATPLATPLAPLPPPRKRQKEKETPKGKGAPPHLGAPPPPPETTPPEEGPSSPDPQGYLQALDGQGVPLCLHCQKRCPVPGPAAAAAATWESGFCSRRCEEELRVRSSQPHMRARVLEAEGGACQQCGLDAHRLYLKVRDAPPAARKDLLENTWLAQLPLKQLNEIIRAPVEGDFWQVDHIRPVYSGGGQCSLDNLQTLCTVCHRTRTSQQAKERSQARKDTAAAKVASSITRFFRKK